MTYGMQASEGAIETVHANDDGTFAIETIGGAPARGLCGSGLIDLVAELRRTGGMTPRASSRSARARSSSARGTGITFSRADGSALAQAKAANTVGQWILLRELGIEPHEVDRLYLAGGFATYVDIGNAIDIGFLAPVARRAHRQGRQRLAARRPRAAALGVGTRAASRQLIARIEHVELETDARFLRAVRRRLPVQAAPGRRAGRPAHGRLNHLTRRCDMPGGPVASKDDKRFIVIGENVHTTRIVRRPGPLVQPDEDGARVDRVHRRERARAPAPDPGRGEAHAGVRGGPRQARAQRRAARDRRRAGPADRRRLPARARARARSRRAQQFLDVNVDEYSHRLPEQIETMRWLVGGSRAARRRAALDRLVEPRHHPHRHARRPGRTAGLRC